MSIIQTPDSSMVIIGSDDQINLLRKCCVRDKAVLNIDLTFNLGPFEVTSLTFKNTAQKNQNTDSNSSPIILGPAMIHIIHRQARYIHIVALLSAGRIMY